jgi:cytochrome b pre-mRNA-processing protein 3
MVQAFYGRAAAYDQALDRPDDGAAMTAAVKRNLYGTVEPEARHVAVMADYVRGQWAALETCDLDALVAGKVAFAPFAG